LIGKKIGYGPAAAFRFRCRCGLDKLGSRTS
jgi:hypothetical protein